MVAQLIKWSVNNPLLVVLATLALAVVGMHSFQNVNVEAYPDPAPAIVEIIAQNRGRSAEDMERLVTVPLEVALSGMPGLKNMRTKSLFGLTYVNTQFEYGYPYKEARQEVINRMSTADFPPEVSPQISPRSPIGEILRYSLASPKDDDGKPIYSLNDLRSIQTWTLERTFRRIPGIVDVTSMGGTMKRYEIRPDPNRMKRYGVTLEQLQTAISKSNSNVSGDYLTQGDMAAVVRGLGLFGRGRDPVQPTLGLKSPRLAALHLRSEEDRRLLAIRKITLKSTNNLPIRVDDIVEGGPLQPGDSVNSRGVVVSNLTRLGKVALSRPQVDAEGELILDETGQRVWTDEDEIIQGLVLLRKGAESLPALQRIKATIDELNNTPGSLPPGIKIQVFYDRTTLIKTTTETVEENLLVGICLVTVILLMFLSNVRSAIIIAINLPLALLFAFAVLFFRGQSANLLSIGAVDFGIIIDSTVIMVENIYRVLSSGKYAELPMKERIIRASTEIQRALFFSTIIMVCAMLPLFTMRGPEGQLFRPMAETYAFAIGGALLLALTIAPVLCLLFFKNLKPTSDNFFVKYLKHGYLRNLEYCLNHRWLVVIAFGMMIVGTIVALPFLGREFMPALEEGHIWARATFPVGVSLNENADKSRIVREIMRKYPEVELVVNQIGRPESGTDPTGFYSSEFFIPLKPQENWVATVPTTGWRKWFGAIRPRTKPELVRELSDELTTALPGVNWNFSQVIRDNVLEVLSGVQGENSVKIIGNDLEQLEELGKQAVAAMVDIPGIKDVGYYRIKGQANVELPIDREKCALWNVSVANVNDVIETAIGGKTVSQMVEGEKSFDITIRWPESLRRDLTSILDIPVVVTDNIVIAPPQSGKDTGAALSTTGFTGAQPDITGSSRGGILPETMTQPVERLRDLVTPQGTDLDGPLSADGQFVRSGVSTISHEEGKRMVAIKFSVRDRDLAGAVSDAQAAVRKLIPRGYRDEWSGEFKNMEEGEGRLLVIVPMSLVLVFLLLYLAFHSFLDATVVLFNVVELSLGGIWALFLTGTNFSIAAAVGFTSIFGVAVMDGLLLVSSFNHHRAHGLPLRQAIMTGAEQRVRPVMMTALTAILGLLPAALSTRIGAQSQKPLAIVVVGSMITTLFLTRYLMPVIYSFYGDREPVEGAGDLQH